MNRRRSWGWVLFGFALAFAAGFAFNLTMAPVAVADTDADIRELRAEIRALEKRINGMKLVFGEQVAGAEWGCGTEESKEAPYVVVGVRDGTGCSVANRNYYRKVELVVPQ